MDETLINAMLLQVQGCIKLCWRCKNEHFCNLQTSHCLVMHKFSHGILFLQNIHLHSMHLWTFGSGVNFHVSLPMRKLYFSCIVTFHLVASSNCMVSKKVNGSLKLGASNLIIVLSRKITMCSWNKFPILCMITLHDLPLAKL